MKKAVNFGKSLFKKKKRKNPYIMDDNTYTNFKSILRSMTTYAKRVPVQQYGNKEFATWKTNSAQKLTEIKKTHPNFTEKDIPEVTEEYFNYAKSNS